MIDELYRCENADKCIVKSCLCHEKHKAGMNCDLSCGMGDFKCIPVASEPKPQDPDVVMAREISKSLFSYEHDGLKALLLRLADKVEGKK